MAYVDYEFYQKSFFGNVVPEHKCRWQINGHCNICKLRQRIHFLRNTTADWVKRKGMECGICRRRRCTENERLTLKDSVTASDGSKDG